VALAQAVVAPANKLESLADLVGFAVAWDRLDVAGCAEHEHGYVVAVLFGGEITWMHKRLCHIVLRPADSGGETTQGALAWHWAGYAIEAVGCADGVCFINERGLAVISRSDSGSFYVAENVL
jgi:hypothetical protein